MIGEIVENYRILEQRREDDLATVYKGQDVRLSRFVSIEALPIRELPDSPARKLLFMEEAWAATTLGHPHILEIYAILEIAGADYVVMEHVRGRTLDRWIARKQLKPSRAVRFAAEICEALEAAHSISLFHGGIRPSSVWISESGRVRVAGFGVHHLLGDISDPARKAYLAPERIGGAAPGCASDIFSLGAVLREMLAGESTPEWLAAVVERCLDPDPSRRYSSASELREALLRGSEPARPAAAVAAAAPKGIRVRRRRHRPRFKWAPAAIAALVIVCAAAFLYWFWPLTGTGEQGVKTTLRQITNVSGVATEPAISFDGDTMAYASDEGNPGRLEVWIQPVRRGKARRLTNGPSDDHEPSLSPDGSVVAFRAEREGGGIWVAHSDGGQPYLLVEQGHRPRISPRGDLVAYWTAVKSSPGAPEHGETYVIPLSGGPARRIAPELATASNPVWSPDGQSLLFIGAPLVAARPDWYVASPSGAPATRTGLLEALTVSRVRAGPPSAWLPNPDRLIVTADHGGGPRLAQLPVNPLTWATGTADDIAPAADITGSASASVFGKTVFARLSMLVSIARIPLAPGGAPETAIGDERFTAEDPAASRDGRWLAYVSDRSGRLNVWVRELASGRDTNLTALPRPPVHPVVTSNGQVLFGVEAERHIYRVPVGGGRLVQMCDGCGSVAWDSTPDGKSALIGTSTDQGPNLAVSVLDVASGRVSEILRSDSESVVGARVSNDGNWITFLTTPGPNIARVRVARFHGAEKIPPQSWIDITDGLGWESKPNWSADGNSLYFLSRRDGFRCLWAQALARETKRPEGAPYPVYHSHSAVQGLDVVPLSDLEIAVLPDSLLVTMGRLSGNVWYIEAPPPAKPK